MYRHVIFGCVLALMLQPAATLGGESTENITWVRHFKAKPGQERNFVKMMKELHGETFDALVKDGKLLSWGIAVPFTRADNRWTHAIWLSAPSWGQIDEFVKAFQAEEEARSPTENKENQQKFLQMIEPDSVHDEVFRTVASTSPRGPSVKRPEYIKVSQYKVKPGGHDAAVALYRKYALPVYEELTSEGVIIGNGFTVREVTSDSEWTHHAWVSASNLSAFDKVREAFEKAKEARSEREQKEFIEKLTKLLDFDAYRSQILRVVHVVRQNGKT